MSEKVEEYNALKQLRADNLKATFGYYPSEIVSALEDAAYFMGTDGADLPSERAEEIARIFTKLKEHYA